MGRCCIKEGGESVKRRKLLEKMASSKPSSQELLRELKAKFPEIESPAIWTVLKANKGNVEATINQLSVDGKGTTEGELIPSDYLENCC